MLSNGVYPTCIVGRDLMKHHYQMLSNFTLNTGDITDENYKHAIDFLENKDVPTFYKPIGKTRALNDSFNRFYIISALRVS